MHCLLGTKRRGLTKTRFQDSFIVDIDAIQAHGIGAVDVAKLKANGYYTIASVHAATRRNLLKIKGFSEIKVEKVKDAIAKCQVCGSHQNTVQRVSLMFRRSPLEEAFKPRMNWASRGSEF